jgi:hypothetical protein
MKKMRQKNKSRSSENREGCDTGLFCYEDPVLENAGIESGAGTRLE